jgi:hypothetical protein
MTEPGGRYGGSGPVPTTVEAARAPFRRGLFGAR